MVVKKSLFHHYRYPYGDLTWIYCYTLKKRNNVEPNLLFNMSIAYCYGLENKKLMDLALIPYSLTSFNIMEKEESIFLLLQY